MHINFILTQEDYIHFNEYHYKTRTSFIEKYLRLILYLFLVVFLIFQIKDDFIGGISNWGNWVFLILAGAYFYFMDKRKASFRKKQAEKLVKENPNLIGKQEITFEENKIIVQTESTKHEFMYNIFNTVEEDDILIYVFMNKNNAFLIPKRDVNSAEVVVFLRNKI